MPQPVNLVPHRDLSSGVVKHSNLGAFHNRFGDQNRNGEITRRRLYHFQIGSLRLVIFARRGETYWRPIVFFIEGHKVELFKMGLLMEREFECCNDNGVLGRYFFSVDWTSASDVTPSKTN